MEQNEIMRDFVKTLSQPDRLRVIGVLAQKTATTKEIAEILDLPVRQIFQNLAMLEHSGIVHKQNQVWSLDPKNIENISRQQFENLPSEKYTSATEVADKTRKILASYLNPDGSIKQIPSDATKLRVILDYLLQNFSQGTIYTEKEVNQIIRHYHTDTAGLRRDLIDRGMLQRKSDGSQYWRPE
jgi:hypothetical protein